MANSEEIKEPQGTDNQAPDVVPKAELEKLLEKTAQSAADRVRTEYSQKLKAAQEDIENLRKEKMSAKERAEYEAAQLKEELERKSRDLTRRELELLATTELEKNGLDIAFIDSVIGSDRDATLGKIAQLKEVFNKAIDKAIDNKMKAHGRDPTKGRVSDGTSIEGMTPAEINAKAREDPNWWAQNESAIMEKLRMGGYKK